jgi:hypothetical protein
MDIDGIELQYHSGIWLGAIATKWGRMEIVLGGTKDSPDERQKAALQRFLQGFEEKVARLRKRLSFGFLYRPIRIAPNDEGRVGVQFRNRFTAYQGHLILEDPRP